MLLNISILSNTLFALALQIIYKHICKEHFSEENKPAAEMRHSIGIHKKASCTLENPSVGMTVLPFVT